MRYAALTLHLRGTRDDPSGEASRTLRNPLQHRRGRDGRVYRARDTRLDRMNPHIRTLFEIGQQDGIDYLVMEYLEGETLARRLLKAPLPLEQGLQYAIEIADAHRKGLTHRDLNWQHHYAHQDGDKAVGLQLGEAKTGSPFF